MFILLLSGCGSKNSFFLKRQSELVKEKISTNLGKTDAWSSRSIILDEVLRSPDVADKLLQIDVAKKRVNVEKTRRNFVFDATASGGVQSEYYDQTKPLLQTSIKAQKLLLDNQNVKKSIELLELDVKNIGVDTFMEIDKKLNDLTVAHIQIKSAQLSALLMTEYLNNYERKKQLISKAVASGVLSKSKSLELKSLEKESLKKLTQFRFAVENSKTFIESNLAVSYERLLPEFEAKQNVYIPTIFVVEGSKQIEKIQIQIKRLDLKKFKLSNSQRPTTKFETVIASPISKDRDYNIFSGISVQFPVKDGGKSDADIALIASQKGVLFSRKSALTQENTYKKKELNTFIKFNNQQKELVKERLSYSKQRIKEFDLISKSGRSDVSIVAKEILTAAKLELEILELQKTNELRILEALEQTYKTCSVYKLCDKIEAFIVRAIEDN